MADKNKDSKDKIYGDLDYIYSPKYEFSLKKFMQRHDEGVDDSHAAKVLLLEPDEVEALYQEAVKNLQKIMNGD